MKSAFLGLIAALVLVYEVCHWTVRYLNNSSPPFLPSERVVSVHPVAVTHYGDGPTIEQIKQLETLVVQQVDVAEVCTTDLQGYLGGARAAVLVRGDVVVAVDLNNARFLSKDLEKRTACLALPQPVVSRPRLDQERTRLVELDRQGLWALVPGDGGKSAAVNQALKHAQQVVATAGSDPQLIERSRKHAENSIVAFFGAVGWRVTIEWTR